MGSRYSAILGTRGVEDSVQTQRAVSHGSWSYRHIGSGGGPQLRAIIDREGESMRCSQAGDAPATPHGDGVRAGRCWNGKSHGRSIRTTRSTR